MAQSISLRDNPAYKKYLEQQRKEENRFGITVCFMFLFLIIPIVLAGIWEWGKRKRAKIKNSQLGR